MRHAKTPRLLLTKKAKKQQNARGAGEKHLHKASWRVVACVKHGTINQNKEFEFKVSIPKGNRNLKHAGCPICRAENTRSV